MVESQGQMVSLSQFPRLDGETDDRGRFRRAIEATPTGGKLWVPPGKYFADSIIVKKSIELSFSSQAKVEGVEPNKDILIIEGEREDREYRLLAPVKRGKRRLLLAEEPVGWKSGDMIVLTDDTVRFSDRQQDVNTEVHEIAYIEGKQVVLRDFVRLPKAVSSQKGNLYRVFPLEDVRVSGFHFQMKEGSKRGIGLRMQYVRNAKIYGIAGYRWAGAGIQIRKAIHTYLQDFRFLSPQATGSGQGYGVQFFGGCLGVTVQNGYTVGCRHAIDLDGSYDVSVSHVTDYCSTGAAFVMSHNGFTSDITFDTCQTYNTFGSGFVANSQGFADPLKCTFYHFIVKDCTVVLNHSSKECIFFTSPCKDSAIVRCQLRFQGRGLNNAGVRTVPARTQIKVIDCRLEGLKRAIAIQAAKPIAAESDPGYITVRDTTIEKCDTAFFCSRGKEQQLRIDNVDCKEISGGVFYFRDFSFHELVIDGLSLLHSPQARFAIGTFNGAPKGRIKRISTDRYDDFSPAQLQWAIPSDQLLLAGDGEVIRLKGSCTISGDDPFPNGWIEGQRLTLIALDHTWVIKKGPNMKLKKANQEAIQLDENQRTVTFIWKAGFWLQID